MSAITMSGSLTMLSTNGDGPQLLTEAAEFLNALAQMGVQMAVEINLRPQAIEKAAILTQPPVGWLSHPVSTGPQPPATLAVGSTNPTPAAPAHPDAPLLLLPWRKLDKEQRHALLHMEGRRLAKALGHPPTMSEWDASRPADYPTASALPKSFGTTWYKLAQSWAGANASE